LTLEHEKRNVHDLIAKLSLDVHLKVTSGTVSCKPADMCMTQQTPFLKKRRGTKVVLLKKERNYYAKSFWIAYLLRSADMCYECILSTRKKQELE
jgi:hypothetical protein